MSYVLKLRGFAVAIVAILSVAIIGGCAVSDDSESLSQDIESFRQVDFSPLRSHEWVAHAYVADAPTPVAYFDVDDSVITLTGEDADEFRADNGELYWADPAAEREARAYYVNIEGGGNAERLAIEVLPHSSLSWLFRRYVNIPIERFKINPVDISRFYLAAGSTVLVIEQTGGEYRAARLPLDSIPDDFRRYDAVSLGHPIKVIEEKPTLDESRCVPIVKDSEDYRIYHESFDVGRSIPHDYIVTIVREDGSPVNGDPSFLNLPIEDQRKCYRMAYLSEVLPPLEKWPNTTQYYIDELPPKMVYDRNDYRVVWAEEFDTLSFQDLNDNYFYARDSGAPADTPNNEYDNTFALKDGDLLIGVPLIPNNAEDKDYCNPDKWPVNKVYKAFDRERCTIDRSHGQGIATGVYFQYGYLEVRYSRLPTRDSGVSIYLWATGKDQFRGTIGIQRWNKYETDQEYQGKKPPRRENS